MNPREGDIRTHWQRKGWFLQQYRYGAWHAVPMVGRPADDPPTPRAPWWRFWA